MYFGPKIVTSGLILNLDAANIKSYTGAGATWSDRSGYVPTLAWSDVNNATLVAGPLYVTNSHISFATGSMYLSCLRDGGNVINNQFAWDPTNVVGCTSISLEVWFNSSQTYFPSSYLFAKPWNGSGQYNYLVKILGTSSFQLSCHLNSGTFNTTISNTPMIDGKWKQFTIWIDTNQIGYNINGTQYSGSFTHSVSGGAPSGGNDALSLAIMTLYPYFGAANPAFSLTGDLSMVKFYRRKLSNDEVIQNYNSQKSRYNL